jgi:hypothetical protein
MTLEHVGCLTTSAKHATSEVMILDTMKRTTQLICCTCFLRGAQSAFTDLLSSWNMSMNITISWKNVIGNYR